MLRTCRNSSKEAKAIGSALFNWRQAINSLLKPLTIKSAWPQVCSLGACSYASFAVPDLRLTHEVLHLLEAGDQHDGTPAAQESRKNPSLDAW